MKKIFLDCGANIGQSVAAWYASNDDAAEYEIYSFEASNKLQRILKENLKKYDNVTIINKVVWSHSKGVQFRDLGNESSSTEPDKMSGGSVRFNTPVFPSLDLSKFIKDNFSKEDQIILKVDIEGGEYHLIPHLIKTDAMSYVNEIYMEAHAAKLSSKNIEDDFGLIDMIENEGLEPMIWTADGVLESGVHNSTEQKMTKDFIINLWKKKGRYRG